MKRYSCVGKGYALFLCNIKRRLRWLCRLQWRHIDAREAEEKECNLNDSCVCTHAMAPARSGLGLALGLVMLLTLAGMSGAVGQESFSVSGKVVSASSGEVLENVTVTNLHNQTVTRTNNLGEFNISVFANDTITFSLVGYNRIEQRVLEQTEFIIELVPSESTLDEVMVIGYGKTSRRLNTGSVSSITATDIEEQPVTNILSAISGRMPGVFVQTSNGLPGSNINIQIRGKGSITAGTQPLFIIDGVPFDGTSLWEGTILSSATNSIIGSLSPLNMINPSDIESISILKDADATAIYGSRGANGVILITTKSSHSERTAFELSFQQGFSSIANRPDLLNLEQHLDIRREAFENEGRIPSDLPSSSDYAPDLTVWDRNLSTDWVEYFFGRHGNTSDLQLTVSGGNSKTNYRLNNFMRRETTVLPGNNRYLRGGLNLNLSHNSDNERFSIVLNNALSIDDHRTANPQGVKASILLPPNYPIRNPDGSYNWYIQNPEASLLAMNRLKSNNVQSSVSLSYKLLNSLELKLNTGYNRLSNGQTQTFPTKSLYPGTVNYTQFGDLSNHSFMVEPQVEYQRTRANSNLTFLLGGTYQIKQGETKFLNAAGFNNEGLMESIEAANSIVHRTNLATQYKFISAFSRATYTLNDRYVMNATYRVDGSSRFGPGNQFGGFGAIGLAWLFADEVWFAKTFPSVSHGKFRTSYGVVGNDQIADYLYLSTYRGSGFMYNGVAGLMPSRISNPELKWETTVKFDVALEMAFFADRLALDINYYINRTRDQLVNYSLPRISGFANYQANIPVIVENKGWELVLQSTPVRRNNFTWSTGINVTIPKNKLVSFENIEHSTYSRTLSVGYDITRVSGYKLIEIDPETGVPIYADENGNPSSSPYAYHTLGKKTPDWYGGISNTFSFRRWSVDVFLQFAKQMSTGGIIYTPGWMLSNYKVVNERWQTPGDLTTIPKAATRNNSLYSRSDANFFDASYLRLKNVSLKYQVLGSNNNQKGALKITAFCNAHNLITCWDRQSAIMDPETGASIPPMRTFVVGLHFTW